MLTNTGLEENRRKGKPNSRKQLIQLSPGTTLQLHCLDTAIEAAFVTGSLVFMD